MKEGIHPNYYQATVTCNCGNTFVTGSTKKDIHVEICSKCHSFYTGQQKATTARGRIEKFNNLMGDIVPSEVKKDLLEKGFFTAPASTKYHGNYEGGLFDHSYMVAHYLKKLTEECRLDWQNPRSPLLVGMFHDLCKMDNYQHPVIAETLGGEEIRDDFKWEYATDTLLKGHGDKSVMVLAQYFKLTEEEIMCIRYHMGAFCDKSEWNDYTRAVHKYTNVLWTHQADMLASHVEGV